MKLACTRKQFAITYEGWNSDKAIDIIHYISSSFKQYIDVKPSILPFFNDYEGSGNIPLMVYEDLFYKVCDVIVKSNMMEINVHKYKSLSKELFSDLIELVRNLCTVIHQSDYFSTKKLEHTSFYDLEADDLDEFRDMLMTKYMRYQDSSMSNFGITLEKVTEADDRTSFCRYSYNTSIDENFALVVSISSISKDNSILGLEDVYCFYGDKDISFQDNLEEIL